MLINVTDFRERSGVPDGSLIKRYPFFTNLDDYIVEEDEETGRTEIKVRVYPEPRLDTYLNAIRSRWDKSLDGVLARDTAAIKGILDDVSISPASGVKTDIRHCITPRGEGYYAITLPDGKKRFCPSEFRLLINVVKTSFSSGTGAYFEHCLLMDFLDTIKRTISKDHNITMRIRPLHFDTILGFWPEAAKDMFYGKNLSTLSALQDNKDIAYPYLQKLMKTMQYDMINDYKEDYHDWCAYMAEFPDDPIGIGWYNGRGNEEYYSCAVIIYDAVSKIRSHKENLEKCGLWEKAKKTMDEMYSILGKVS